MTKGGRASMANVVLLEAWSNSRLGRRDACIAMGKAMAKAMICEKMISSRSMGNDCGDDARRRLVRRERLAEVALEDVADPDEVLLPQGLVQAELVVDGGDVLRGGVGPEDGDGRVAREQVDQEEGGDGDEEDDDDEQHQPSWRCNGPRRLFPPSVCLDSLRLHARPHRRRMILDRDALVLPCGPCPRRFLLSAVARAPSVGVARRAGRRRRVCPPLLDPLGPVARRGADRRHRPPARCTSIPNALKHDGAPPLYYVPPALLDRPLRPVQRRRALALGHHRA